MQPVKQAAEAARADRKPVSADNPFLAFEQVASTWISTWLDTYRIARDGEEESSILKKLLAAKLGVGKDSAIVSEFGGKRIVREPVPIAKDEPLKLELQHFIECVREKQTPMVSGASAKQALDLAFEITRQVQQVK